MNETHHKKQLYIALIFLLVLLTLNFTLRQITQIRQVAIARESFEEASFDIRDLMNNKITSYIDVLYYGKKLFEASDMVSRTEFNTFYLDLFNSKKDDLNAIEMIAYVEKVTDKKTYVNRIRAEKTQTPFQFLYFNLTTQEDKKTGYIFNYISPNIAGSRYFGYDATENPQLSQAFSKSEADHALVSTQVVNQFGKDMIFLIQPIYEKNTLLKATAVSGYIVMGINPSKMFDNIFSSQRIGESINIETSFLSNNGDPFYYEKNVALTEQEEKFQSLAHIKLGDKEVFLKTEASIKLDQTLLEQFFPDILFFGSSTIVLGFFMFVLTVNMDKEEKKK